MRHVDVAIVGGGLAGSLAAGMLSRAGIDAVVIDGHAHYPDDFRCEKLDQSQVALLERTGLADAVLQAAKPIDELWIARFGRLVQKRRNHQFGIAYDALVNAVRAQVPAAAFIHAKVAAIAPSPDRQTLSLSNGETISARLAVLATGLNIGLRHMLGVARETVSPCHSVSIGFDVRPAGRPAFAFRALTYYGERTRERVAYLCLFPMGAAMRANLFVYRDQHDPWLHRMRVTPHDTLHATLPGLARIAGRFEIAGPVKIRPVDLMVTRGYRQPGIALVGDAFGTSCPAAGTGVNKVLTDVVRLCAHHIPRWLATPGMAADKIAAYYDDDEKLACDAASLAKAYDLRALSTEDALPMRARRWVRFLGQLGVGILGIGQEPPIPETAEHAELPAGRGAPL